MKMTHKMYESLRTFACLKHSTKKKTFTISPDSEYIKFEFEEIKEIREKKSEKE